MHTSLVILNAMSTFDQQLLNIVCLYLNGERNAIICYFDNISSKRTEEVDQRDTTNQSVGGGGAAPN
jgi:hypothetical protein